MHAEHTMLNYCTVKWQVQCYWEALLLFFFFTLIKMQSYLNQNVFLTFKNTVYKIRLPFSEAWGGFEMLDQLFLSGLEKKATCSSI